MAGNGEPGHERRLRPALWIYQGNVGKVDGGRSGDVVDVRSAAGIS